MSRRVADAAAEIGDPQVRNRGTLGGSLAHADPSADYPAVMLALDAEIHVKGPNGWRVVKARDFFQDLFTVDLAPDEIIAGVHIAPVEDGGVRQAPPACVALRDRRRCRRARREGRRHRVGAHRAHRRRSHAVRLTNVEQALAGKKASKDAIGAAAKLAGVGLDQINSDVHAGEEYRRAMIPVFTRRALEAALARG